MIHHAQCLEFFGVDHHTFPGQWDRATGVTGAAASRHDGEFQVDACFDQQGHFGFGVWRQHHKRVLHPPIGGICDMRHAAHGVKFDVVGHRVFAQHPLGAAAQFGHHFKLPGKFTHSMLGLLYQLAHQDIAFIV